MPALRTMLANQDIDARLLAAEAIARIDPVHCDDAIRVLSDVVSGKMVDGRRNVVILLGRIGPSARTAIPALLDFMRSSETPRDAADAASAALKIDPIAAPEAVERFRSAILGEMGDDGDDWLDRLRYLGRAAKPLMPALIEALASKQEAIRDAAISAIADLGPHAKDTLPALRALEKTAAKKPERLAEAIKRVERKK